MKLIGQRTGVRTVDRTVGGRMGRRSGAIGWRLAAVALTLTGLLGGLLGPNVASARTAATEIVHSSVALWITECEAEFDPEDDDPDVIEQLTDGDCGEWGNGSGTVIDSSGLILTNAHVVLGGGDDDPYWLEVGITDDPRDLPTYPYFARPVAIDRERDLALVQVAYDARGRAVEARDLDLPALPLAADTADLTLEDPVRLIGYPGVGGITVTVIEAGVSGFLLDATNVDLGNEGWIKVSPAAGSGVSGGTAVNEDGELIGVPTATYGTDLRCNDYDGDDAFNPPTECTATGGEAQLVRPIEVVHQFLERNGIEIEQERDRGRDDRSDDDEDDERGRDRDRDRDEDDDRGRDEDEAVESVALTVEATVVDAATGKAVRNPTLLVMQPGLTFEDLDTKLIEKGDLSQFAAIGEGDRRGRVEAEFEAIPGEEYTLIFVADGYVGLYHDGLILVEEGEDEPTPFDYGEAALEEA
jgi:S1-C subfamily serine protease